MWIKTYFKKQKLKHSDFTPLIILNRYFIYESVQTGTGERNPEVAGQNCQKMNIAKNRQIRRVQAFRITKVKKGSEIKNIWPRQKNAGRRVENKDPTKIKSWCILKCYNGATLHACDMINHSLQINKDNQIWR